MLAVISIIVVLTLSLIITRIATIALTLTGLSRESAKFQARSAFTGVGFTTSEAEKVVNHPVRRRILLMLMLLGNAGIVTAISSIILTFVGTGSSVGWFWRLVWLILGLSVFWTVATSSWIDRRLSPFITWSLKRWSKIDARDYARVLHLAGEYGIVEMEVEEQDWLAHNSLSELDLSREGVLVLGIQRTDGRYVGAPKGTTQVFPGDTLILYGRSPVLADIDRRRADSSGELAHRQRIIEQQHMLETQSQFDQTKQQEEVKQARK
jgi:hypothetical protein